MHARILTKYTPTYGWGYDKPLCEPLQTDNDYNYVAPEGVHQIVVDMDAAGNIKPLHDLYETPDAYMATKHKHDTPSKGWCAVPDDAIFSDSVDCRTDYGYVYPVLRNGSKVKYLW